jgi:hypothetical protein
MIAFYVATILGFVNADNESNSDNTPKSTSIGQGVGDSNQTKPPDSQTVVIPLNDIWGNISLQSRPLRSLEPEFFTYRDTPEKIEEFKQLSPEQIEALARKADDSLTKPIERAMSALIRSKETTPRPGFAVKGNGRDALKGVHDVLVRGRKTVDRFSPASDVSVVFFSYPTQPNVAFDRVERTRNKVTIYYMLLTHLAQNVSWRLAIIPLGKLPPGTYDVELIRSPKEKDVNEPNFPPVRPKLEDKIICKPFKFVVTENE